MRLGETGRIRRSTIAYAAVFCAAVVLYFLLRPDPADPLRSVPVIAEPTTTTTTTRPAGAPPISDLPAPSTTSTTTPPH